MYSDNVAWAIVPTGTDFDTSELDKGLRADAIPITTPVIQVHGTSISKTGAVVLFQPENREVRLAMPDKEAHEKFMEFMTKDGEAWEVA